VFQKMATEVDTTEIDAQIDNDKRLNKTEKKARKALAKLGLKPVANVTRVTMKKQPSILFLIAEPEVFKSPAAGGQETYVVYGQCQIDDGTQRRMPQQRYPANFNPAAASGGADEEDDDMPEMTPAGEPAGGSASAGGDADAEGLAEKDIEMVMAQASCDRKKAIAALKKNGGDIVNSIMDLTM
jgi:nascent polypeptide-associated complex subunit alpha